MSSNHGSQKSNEKGQNMPPKQRSDEKVTDIDRNKITQDIDYAAVDVKAGDDGSRDLKAQHDKSKSAKNANDKKPDQKSSNGDMNQKNREDKAA